MSEIVTRRGMQAGWRELPMPSRVAALPRTHGGIPITYTVAWSSEHGIEVRPDPILAPLGHRSTPAIFAPGGPGIGTPKLQFTETSRQRRAAVLGLCQVCGRPIPEPTGRRPRWLADLRKHGQTIVIRGLERPLVVDTWTCTECLGYALQVCPGLIRKQAENLRLLRVRSYRLVATFEVPEQDHDFVPPAGAIGLMKIAPLDFDFVDPHDALSQSTTPTRGATDG